MDPMVSGLRYRVRRAARQIGEQHRHLGEVLGKLEAILAEGSREGVDDLLVRYRSALDAHFALEDDVFFPALHGLHPEHAEELEALSRDHEAYARVLEELAHLLQSASLDRFARELRQLEKDLERHESREERLVRSLVEEG